MQSEYNPLDQLPRRKFIIDRNVWLPIVIVVVLIVMIVWFAGTRLFRSSSPDQQPSTNMTSGTNLPPDQTNSNAPSLSDTNESAPNNSNTATTGISNDTDNDGLTNDVETKIYLTDPSKKDTDGDGYDDATEITGGYNPNGTGNLTTTQRTALSTTTLTAGNTTYRWEGDRVTVSWITSKDATAIVEYGPTDTFGTRNNSSYGPTIHHQFTATSSTDLHYGIWSCTPIPDPACAYLTGVAKQLAPTTPSPQNDTVAPVISNVTASQREADSYVVVRWKTDKRSNGYVQFGKSTNYTEQNIDYSQSETDHWSEIFPGYETGMYHYKITACNPFPNDKVCASTGDGTLSIKYTR